MQQEVWSEIDFMACIQRANWLNYTNCLADYKLHCSLHIEEGKGAISENPNELFSSGVKGFRELMKLEAS